MAKIQSFADKMAKGTKDFSTHCPECDESYTLVQLVASEKSEKSGDNRFITKMVKMCKCNENDLTK